MARPSVAARNLSLTEELERLEQSITLTLQEIDHNFSKSHRIVTSSILPLVEQYGEHSRAIWEASKFWKQFFEASANVSLSGYEEANNEGETTVGPEGEGESTAMRDDDDTAAHADDETRQRHDDESMLDEADIAGSTPRHPPARAAADLHSPYENMKKEMQGGGDDTTVLQDDDDQEEEDSTVLMAQRTAQLPDMSMTPRGAAGTQDRHDASVQRSGKDPLLHRVLDKNYRVQATPHKTASPLKGKQKATATPQATAPASWRYGDDSPLSSPEIAAPKLRSEAFMSPYKSTATARLRQQHQQQREGPRTPGVSVQTPGTARKSRDAFASSTASRPAAAAADDVEIDWDIGEEVDDDDVDLYAGMSPPKTIQFALPPSKLLQTPAREASKRIVDDILQDAGAEPESSEYSPTMVKMNEKLLDDSF